jgi:hypothetical protein
MVLNDSWFGLDAASETDSTNPRIERGCFQGIPSPSPPKGLFQKGGVAAPAPYPVTALDARRKETGGGRSLFLLDHFVRQKVF